MTTAVPSSQPTVSSPGSTIISPSEPSTEDEATYEDLTDIQLYEHLEARYGVLRDADIILAIGFAHEAMRIAYIAGEIEEVRERGVYVATRSRWLAHRMKMAARRAEGLQVTSVPVVPQVTRHKMRGMVSGKGRPLARKGTWSFLEEELCSSADSTPWHDYSPVSPGGNRSSMKGGTGGELPFSERACKLVERLGVPPDSSHGPSPCVLSIATEDENRLAVLYCESDLTLEQCKSFFGIP
ncbi:hypothetical protein P7C70_g5295, partial [Phenoliferia sp. Uapishka_3]